MQSVNDPASYSGEPRRNVYGPITPGQLLERTAALLRESPGLFLGLGLLLFGIELVISGVSGGSGLWLRHFTSDTAPVAKALVMMPLAMLGAAIIYIFTQIVQGALFFATHAKLTGAPITAGEACSLAAKKVWRLVGISILIALRIFGFVLLLYMAVAMLIVIVALMFGGLAHNSGHLPLQFIHSHWAALGIFGMLLLGLGLLYLVFLFWLVLRYAVSIPAALAENLHATDSIRRSIQLTRNGKGRLVALYLAIFAIYIVFLATILPMELVMVHAAHAHTGGFPASFRIYGALLSIIGNAIGAGVVVFIGIGATLCYYDLRVRKEGFGGELPAPGLQAPPPAAQMATPDWPIEDLPIS